MTSELPPDGEPHQPNRDDDPSVHTEASSDMADLEVPQDLSDPRWKHFRPDVQGEFVPQDVGDVTINDEDELIAQHGLGVFDGGQADIAQDWVEFRESGRLLDPTYYDRYLHAHLLGKDEIDRRLDEAEVAGDVEQFRRAFNDLFAVDPRGILDAISRALDARHENSVISDDEPGDDESAEKDSPQ